MNRYARNYKVLILNKSICRYNGADYYRYAFQQLGQEAYILNLFYNPFKEYTDSKVKTGNKHAFFKERLFRRVMYIIWKIKQETRQRIILKIKEIKPDIVMIMGDIEIEPDIFKEIKKLLKSCHIFCYLADPLTIKNNLILEGIPFYDCIFTFSKFQIPLIYWFGARRVEYLPFAYDQRLHRVIIMSNNEKEFYGSDIAYLGAWQPHIELWINELTPYYLKVWGNQWYKLRGYPDLKRCWQGEGVGLFDEMAKVINSSKITFNLVRHHNGNGHSMKTFEIPACGGFMLTNRTEEQLDLFPEDKCAVYFSTAEELKDKIKYYLNNAAERARISKAAYEVAKPHTYFERAKEILSIYEEIR